MMSRDWKFRIFVILSLATLAAPASAGKRFMAYEGRDAIQDGVGGTKVTTDGIDFWTTGTPPHRFQVIGIIDDKRGGGWMAGKAIGAHSIAKMIRDAGGNAALVLDQSSAVTGFVQGAGLGFLFVPLTTVTFETLPAKMRAEGTGLYNLSRNIGSSVGISIVMALLSENTQANHADIATYVTPFNPAFQNPEVMKLMSPFTEAGRAALDGAITLQATIISYIDDFRLMTILSIVAIPLLLLLRKADRPQAMDHSVVME